MPTNSIEWINTVQYSFDGFYKINDSIFAPNDEKNRYYQQVQEWEAVEGNIIEPYDQYEGITLIEAYRRKDMETDAYAHDLIVAAHSNPIVGIEVDGDRHMVQVDRRRGHRSDLNSSGDPLNANDIIDATDDQYLSSYETKISADQNNVINTIHGILLAANVMNFDVSAQIWTTWNPPIGA